MRVLMITDLYPLSESDDNLNSPLVIHEFCKEWVALGNEVVVIRPVYTPCLLANKNDFSDFIKDKVKVHLVPFKKFRGVNIFVNFLNIKAIKQIEELGNFDLVVCHTIFPSLYLSKYVKSFEKRILTLHNTDLKHLKNKLHSIIFQKSFSDYPNSINSIFGRSNVIASQAEKLLNTKIDGIILSGINELYFLDEPPKSSLSINEEIKLVIVARLIKLKNIDILIEAMSSLSSKYFITLTIIGDGPEKDALENLTEKLNLKNNVFFKGKLKSSEISMILRQSHIFVMVSKPETFGISYIEAMASGCITVGTVGQGIESVIINGQNGFLIKPNIEEVINILDFIINLTCENQQKIMDNAYYSVQNFKHNNAAKLYLQKLEGENL